MKEKLNEITQILKTEVIPEIGLLTGIGGQILTCSELFLHKKISQNWLLHLHHTLEDRLCNENFIPTHCGGLAGVGWLYEYLSAKNVIEEDTNVLLEEFDNYLEKSLKNYMLRGSYDFLHGGVGVALYFTKRVAKKKELIPVLAQFLEDLERTGTQQEDGTIKWLSFLGEQHNPQHGYNISLSHGMASIVVILSKLYEIEGINKEKTERLLRGTVHYILVQEISKEKYGCYFPSFALESMTDIYKSRFGWCYGDLGIASALYQAGTVLKEKNWVNKSLEIFLFAALQRKDETVADAILCHGAAGIGHIFYRMWWNTRLSKFKTAADYWFEQTLKMAAFTDGLAGYKTLEAPDGKTQWLNKYGLLDGIAGIGLAMHTYYYEKDPAWDECLLLS
jgi:lantibiotic modifying enzyme